MEEPAKPTRKRYTVKKRVTLVLCIMVLIAGVIIGQQLSKPRPKPSTPQQSPVPAAISKAADFTVYYPDQAKLPKGYTLSTTSFSNSQPGTILYSVKYGDGKKLVFSLQKKPSDEEIQQFYTNYLPLRNHVDSSVGQAEVGAYSNQGKTQTLVSLPTKSGTWILITAPTDINQDDLGKILDSLKS